MAALRFFFLTLLIACAYILSAQSTLPILKSTTGVVSIKDGNEFRKDYWTLDPAARPDIYVADKTSLIKTVTYYSDIDSISFSLHPYEKHDFLILLNEKDSCFNQLKSGLNLLTAEELEVASDTIPFTLTPANNISIQGIVNEQDTLPLMFHLAANSVALIQAATANMKSINFDNTTDANAWGGSGQMRYSRNNSLQIGKQKWESLAIWEDRHSGPGTAGKFGPNLFDNKIVIIDFDKNILILQPKLPSTATDYSKFNIKFKRSGMFLEGVSSILGKAFPNDFMLHSGYGGTLLLDDDFVAKHKINEQITIIKEKELKDSFGNIIKTQKALLPAFDFGATTFTDIPVGFFEGAIGRQKQSVLGADLLKRFNIILDLQRAEIYLKPNTLSHLPFSEV